MAQGHQGSQQTRRKLLELAIERRISGGRFPWIPLKRSRRASVAGMFYSTLQPATAKRPALFCGRRSAPRIGACSGFEAERRHAGLQLAQSDSLQCPALCRKSGLVRHISHFTRMSGSPRRLCDRRCGGAPGRSARFASTARRLRRQGREDGSDVRLLLNLPQFAQKLKAVYRDVYAVAARAGIEKCHNAALGATRKQLQDDSIARHWR